MRIVQLSSFTLYIVSLEACTNSLCGLAARKKLVSAAQDSRPVPDRGVPWDLVGQRHVGHMLVVECLVCQLVIRLQLRALPRTVDQCVGAGVDQAG